MLRDDELLMETVTCNQLLLMLKKEMCNSLKTFLQVRVISNEHGTHGARTALTEPCQEQRRKLG